MNNQHSQIVLTGDRATGKLHLGHLAGSLLQRVELQHSHQQTILIADMQGLTDNGQNPEKVSANILNIVADYLAAGIDPNKTTICLQSALPALAELTMFYSNLVTVSRLERNPTVKTEIKNKGFERSVPVGFFTYPISQAADITAFKATLVPVGDDQLPMLEQSNEIVRKLNSVAGQNILPECKPLLSNTSRLPSLNGKTKMSKSAGPTINLDSTNKEIINAVNQMYTDPKHISVDLPGQVESNVVFAYLDAFHPDKTELEQLKAHYQRGGLGDGKTKKLLSETLIELITPMRERRALYKSDKAQLIDIVKQGTLKSQQITNKTCNEVKAAFGLKLF